MDMKRTAISATAVPVRGNDIDTDRILPARYLKAVVFEGLGEHAFEDDRAQLRESGRVHPFDDPRFSGAQVLLVNQNFGCGSSREHAPQALVRWGRGIRAVVGQSFAEIFHGNCTALGVPCVSVDAPAIEALMRAVEQNPGAAVEVDLVARVVRAAGHEYPLTMPEGARVQLVEGKWDATAELLANRGAIEATAARLGYFHAYA